MPVVVTGADTVVGRALIPLLRGRGSEVRATVRDTGAADELRALGAKVAAEAASDADTLRAVLDEAHTVCLLMGDLFLPTGESYEETIVESTRTVLRVGRKAKVTRVLLVSYPGASSTSKNDFLRSEGLAEDAVRDAGLEHAILRCTHIYGPGSSWLEFMVRASKHRPAAVLGSGTQRLAPVFSVDVARALAAADDRAVPVSGTYGLQGPDVLTAVEFADLLTGAVEGDPVAPEWSPTIGEVLAADCLADAPDADREFGLERTPLIAGLAASGIESPAIREGPTPTLRRAPPS
jgi:NADH dehydrogenase